MRKIINSTYVTLDGVISNPHLWSLKAWSEESGQYAKDLLWASDALVMGRATYDGFAEAWTSRAGDAFADRMNGMAKYVASTTLEKADWNNTTVFKDDAAGEIARLKEQPGQNILQYGFGSLSRTLVEHGLLDELQLWIHPIFVGASSPDELLGKEGFEAHFELAETKTLDTGVIILTYRPAASSE